MLRSRISVMLSRVGVFPVQLDPPTLGHAAVIRNVAAEFSIDRVVLLPYTKFAVTIQHSLHLAALAKLATKTMPNVSVDFSALETPNSRLPRIAQLLEEHGPQSVLLHWSHDCSKIEFYEGYKEIRKHDVILLEMTDTADDDPQLLCNSSTRLCKVSLRRGSETRRLLFEGEVDPCSIVSPAVLKYINTHQLYLDFRRSKTHIAKADSVRRGHSYDFSLHACFDATIPRLELCYDPSNAKALELAAQLKEFQVLPGQDPDLIVPIGGDGYMMQTIRRNWSRFIPFFGVNAGHVGYLLNDPSHIDELISLPLKVYHANMLHVTVNRTESSSRALKQYENLAFNDAWIERSTGQTALIDVAVNGEKRLTQARGDGMLISTPAGSTAYAIALGASPLPVGASMIQLVGSNISSPIRFKPVHLNLDVVVDMEPQDIGKRPCRGYVDGVDVGEVSKMSVRCSRVAAVQLAFSKSCDLQSKLYKLQFPNS